MCKQHARRRPIGIVTLRNGRFKWQNNVDIRIPKTKNDACKGVCSGIWVFEPLPSVSKYLKIMNSLKHNPALLLTLLNSSTELMTLCSLKTHNPLQLSDNPLRPVQKPRIGESAWSKLSTHLHRDYGFRWFKIWPACSMSLARSNLKPTT